ncbi:MAG: G8 domain-containing protein [Planctomycetes bacterium]|nr:G8 domain-containing protein [Planctomycetota bacterium]
MPQRTSTMTRLLTLLAILAVTPFASADAPKETKLIRSAKSGPWSSPATWESGKVPGAGARVQVAPGHRVVYDVKSDDVIRFLHVAGILTFAHDKDTTLNVGLVKIQAGNDATENGFDCDAPGADAKDFPPGVLLVGTPGLPIDAKHTALIRLHYVKGHDPLSCPAIVCCGGGMDLHGAPMSRTWVKLGATARKDATEITLAEPVTGWKPGDRVILTATTRQIKVKKTFRPSTKDSTETEERIIKAIAGTKITLDKALWFEHRGDGDYRGEVANLSRNVVIESADPRNGRGHTMIHHGSAGSISYAEFRQLGMPGVLGRYNLHYHQCGDSMRGSSVIGASFWDSGNRWLTIHGTNYIVVRDCVGYQSLGHGFFLEDGTEVFNVLDRNLAVQAYNTKPLPRQIIPFDKNDGAGFWWANCHNSFINNVAAECDEYGYFFQAAKTPDFDPKLNVMRPDGTKARVDIRTLPFVRFEDNVTHCQRRHGFNLGGGVPFGPPNVGDVGPDEKHPFLIKNFKAYNVHWAIHPVAPCVLIENLDIQNAEYGIWRPVYNKHAYASINFKDVPQNLMYAFEPQGRPTLGERKPLQPVDDLPPITVITHVLQKNDKLLVRGTTSDNGTVTKVLVNGEPAKATRPNFAEWEITLDRPRVSIRIEAHAEDAAGNVEKHGHKVTWTAP